MKLVLCLILYLLAPGLAGAQKTEALKKMPGFVDFSGLDLPENAENSVEVHIQGPLLTMVGEAARHEDPELGQILSDLKLIRVQTYEDVQELAEDFKKKMATIARQLEQKGWQKTVRVREKDEDIYVYLKYDRNLVIGLMVMAAEAGDEVVFVNIVGDIDLAKIGRLGANFNISPLDSLHLYEKIDKKGK